MEDQVKNMIAEMTPDMSHDEKVQVVNGQIGYKEQDQINFKMHFGYKTVYAHYQ